MINWTSEDEINIGHYEVEAGTDGINFTKIANVNTLSVPGNAKNYSFTDNTNYLNASVVYYRIKSIDMDGLHSDYTNIVSVKRVGKTKGALNINPNITSGNINIRFLQTEASKVQLSVVDLSGKTVINKEQATSKGMNNINMDLGQLANGLYYVKILDGENSYIQSVLKN